MTLSVIVVTLNRPECVRRCLECLREQSPPPEQIIVVDSSKDDRTRRVAAEYAGVVYLRNDTGRNQTTSRNIGLRVAGGEIVAYVDDDAYAHPGWAKAIVEPYADPAVAGVGGRALNNVNGEATIGLDEIGQVKPNGLLTGFFAADPGRVIDVDHIIGANMSFRASLVADLGGFREEYPGISGIREETDISLRLKALGHKILFAPAACVDHVAAPQVKGKRFDTRYAYYHKRNSLYLLIRNYGFSGVTRRYVLKTLKDLVWGLIAPIGNAVITTCAVTIGAVIGGTTGTLARLRRGRDPILHDPQGEEIRAAMRKAASETNIPAESEARA